MKVLHVLYSGLGGHGNVFFSMLTADENKAFEYEALFNGVEEVREEYKERCNNYRLTWNFVKKKPGLDIAYYIKLYRQIKKAAPEVVFLHGGAAVIPAMLAKLTCHAIKKIVVRETQANHLKSKIDWVYLITAMLFANRMVYLSEEYKNEIKTKLPFLFVEKKSVVIPNGINLHTYCPIPKMQTNNKDAIIIGMQSRLIAIKDHITLITAFNQLQKNKTYNIKLFLAGDGEYKQTLVDLVSSLGLQQKVLFVGMLKETDLVTFLHNTDIYVHASLGETMSTAIMQAMACKLPIIASNVAGINNMIKDGVTGILVQPQNSSQIEIAINTLLQDKTLATTLSTNANKFANENYSNTAMFAKYSKLFE
jgi:L-malate glycosyltransferase